MIRRITANIALLISTVFLMSGCISSPSQGILGDEEEIRTVGGHVLNCVETSGHHVYKEEMICPLGGEKFEAFRLGTHSTFGVSLDWEPASYMRFPIPLPVCHSNGFIVMEEEMSGDEISRVSSIVESETYQSYFSERHATFFLYAKLTELLEEKEDDRWWYYRQATSEADLCQSPARYREYALLTIREGEARLASLTSSEDEYWTLSIVIPNMYRRMGDFDAARKWLDRFDQSEALTDSVGQHYHLAFKLLREAILEQRSERIVVKQDQ